MATANLSVGINTTQAKTDLQALKSFMQTQLSDMALSINEKSLEASITRAMKGPSGNRGYRLVVDTAALKSDIQTAINDAARGAKAGVGSGGSIDATKLTAEFSKVQQQVSTLNAEIGKLSAVTPVAQATTATKQLGNAHKEATGHVKGHSEAVKQHREQQSMLHSTLRGVAGGLDNLWLTYGRYVSQMVGAYAVITLARTAATKGLEFDYQTRFIAALGDDRTPGAYKDVQQGLQGIKDSPADVNELASALRVLQQTGVDAADGLGLLPTVISAATLGETTMKTATEDLVGVLEVFNLHSDDPIKLANNFKNAGDVMAYVAQETKANLHDVAQSLQGIVGVASQYGVKIETAAAAVAMLGKQGIVGARAGTYTRSMMESLYVPTSQKAEKAFKELDFDMFDKKTGEVKDNLQGIVELVNKIRQYDPKSQAKLIDTMFPAWGAKAFRSIFNDLDAFIAKQKEASEQSGLLARQTEEVAKSTSYQLKQLSADFSNLLTSAWEGNNDLAEPIRRLRDTINDPSVRESLSRLVTGIVSVAEAAARAAPYLIEVAKAALTFLAFRTAAGAVSTLAVGAVALTGVLTTLGTTATNLTRVVGILAAGKATLLMRTVGLGGALAGLSGPFGLVAGLLAAGATAWVMWGDKGAEALQKVKSGAEGAIGAIRNLQEQQAVGFAIDSKSWTLAGDRALRERTKTENLLREQLKGADLGLNFDSVSGTVVNSAGQAVTSTKGWMGTVQELAGQYRELTTTIQESNTAASEARKAEEQSRIEISKAATSGSLAYDPKKTSGGGRASREAAKLENSIIQDLEKRYQAELKTVDAYYAKLEKIESTSAQYGIKTKEEAESKITALTEEHWTKRLEKVSTMSDEMSALLGKSVKLSEADAQKAKTFVATAQEEINTLKEKIEWIKEEARLRAEGAALKFNKDIDKNNVDLTKELELAKAAVYGKVSNPVERARNNAETLVSNRYAQMIQEAVDARIQAEQSGNEASIKATAERLELLDEEVKKAKQYYGDQYAALAEYQQTASYGWDQFWEKYEENATTAAKVVEQSLESVTKNIEDAFADMFKTGKFDAKKMVDSILSDVGRLVAKLAVSDLGNLLFGKGKPSGDVLGSILGMGGNKEGGGIQSEGLSGLLTKATEGLKGFWDSLTGATSATIESTAKTVEDVLTMGTKKVAETSSTAALTELAAAAQMAATSLSTIGSTGGGGGGGILGGLLGAVGGSGTSAASATADFVPYTWANGGAFRNGIQAFAKGGTFSNSIVRQPTLFRFADGTGMMGEAGPEAIMPLTRDSQGRLGVRYEGREAPQRRSDMKVTNNNISVSINAPGGDPAQVRRSGAAVAREVAGAVAMSGRYR